jgi:hypothetical protein
LVCRKRKRRRNERCETYINLDIDKHDEAPKTGRRRENTKCLQPVDAVKRRFVAAKKIEKGLYANAFLVCGGLTASPG